MCIGMYVTNGGVVTSPQWRQPIYGIHEEMKYLWQLGLKAPNRVA